MEADYKDMLSYCAEKKLATKDLPEAKRAHAGGRSDTGGVPKPAQGRPHRVR